MMATFLPAQPRLRSNEAGPGVLPELTEPVLYLTSLALACAAMTFATLPPPARLSTGLHVHDLWQFLEHLEEEDSSALAYQVQQYMVWVRQSFPSLRNNPLVTAYWEHLERLCRSWILGTPTDEALYKVQDVSSSIRRKILVRTWFLHVDYSWGDNMSYLRGSRLNL